MGLGSGGEFVGGSPAPAAAGTPQPGSTPGTVQTLTALQMSTGLVLDATSNRFLYLEGQATVNSGFITLHMGPTSGTTVAFDGPPVVSGGASPIAVFVPKGWFVTSTLFNATFGNARYW